MRALQKLSSKTLKSSAILCNSTCYFSTHFSNPIPEIPTSAYYDNLINKAGRDRDFAAVENILNKRFRDGCFNTHNTFKFISTDLSVLDELLETLVRLHDGFPRKSAYDCLIAQLSKVGRTREAMRVAEIMVRNSCGANASTFHPILNALTKKKEMDEAWRVVDVMRACKINPDLTAYNYFLTAYCFLGDYTSAAAVLGKMEEAGMGADSRTYDALVLGACKVGKIDGALRVLRCMVDDGVPTLYSTHTHVIGGMLKHGYYAQALEFVMSYAGKDPKLDAENFGILASRLINLDRLDEAKFLVKEMGRRKLKMGDKLKEFHDFHVEND